MMEATLTDRLSSISEQLPYLIPEGMAAATLLLVVLCNVVLKGKDHTVYGWVTMLGTLLSLGYLAFFSQTSDSPELFFGLMQADDHSQYVRVIALVGTVIATVWSFSASAEKFRLKGEYYVLLLGLLLGAMFLGASTHLLMVYLALETLSLSGYLATHLREDKRSAESSMKYLLFGAVSSGVLLYSLSWVYGITGTLSPLSYEFWNQLSALPLLAQMVLGVGVTFAIAFKISAAPAHLWAPDVYETAPLPLVAFFSVVPKVAAATLLIRLGAWVTPASISSLDQYWGTLWPLIIMATLLIGNLAALLQGKAMRLMAYSSIAHSGFLLLAALAAPWVSTEAFRLYGLVYLLMNFAAFGLIQQLHLHTGTDRISEWKGWGQQLTFPAIMLLIVMIALVGLPPTAGFIAKLITLSAVFDVYSQTGSIWMAWAGGIGLFSTVVALFYYLKIPFFLFFKKNEIFATNRTKFSYREVLVSVLTLLLLIGFFRSDLMLEALNHLF